MPQEKLRFTPKLSCDSVHYALVTSSSVAKAWTVGRRFGVGLLATLVLIGTLLGCGSHDKVDRHTAGNGSFPHAAVSPYPGFKDPHTFPIISSIEPAQLANFALLRTHPQGLSSRVRDTLAKPTFGINWKLVHRIPVALPGHYWLAPGRGYLCIIAVEALGSPGVGMTCAETSQTLKHGIADTTIRRVVPGLNAHPARQIVGVAPDGICQANLNTHGSIETVKVVNELFVLRDSMTAPVDTITLLRAHRHQ